jgi:hypothetical protein
MAFKYDTTGVKSTTFIIPEGDYVLQIKKIEEGSSSKQDPQVKVYFTPVHPSGYQDNEIWHWVTFLPPENAGAGIAIHFLKCLEEPNDGKILVNPKNWVGKLMKAHVAIEKNASGKDQNKVKRVDPYKGDLPLPNVPATDEEVPF